MIEQTVKLKGAIELMIRGSDGRVKSVLEKDNLIVTVGKSFLASWLAATSHSNSFMPYTATGSGTNAPTSGDTALQTEVARAANTPSSSSNVLALSIVFAPGTSTGAITEAGLFSASSGGTMFSHVTFAVQNILAGDSLTINWSVTFS